MVESLEIQKNVDLNLYYYQLLERKMFLLTRMASKSIFFKNWHDFAIFNSAFGVIPEFKPGRIFTLYSIFSIKYLSGGSWGNSIR
ncbi:MAG: hypothetical protein DRP54_04330 [Spirochaetes bacterium]|nr:MAG: hypothetical protein DRP54_04330 [Spirochaetota bacterium]